MKSVLLDANVLLRFLRDDDVVQSPQARKLMSAAQAGKVRLLLTALTVAETFHALRTSYEMSREEAAGWLEQLMQTGVFVSDEAAIINDALRRVKAHNVDFGDAMLAAEAVASGMSVASFNNDFKKFSDVIRHDWKGKDA